jgi:demethylmenaquinone methyltransferase/2-methoxy-6-polyprenyl-1,4-benzoquinol methylase
MATSTSPAESNAAVDKSGTRVREMFRQIAPRYDAMNHVLSLNIDRYWRWRAVRRLTFFPNIPVLDTCTGTGDLAIAIDKQAPDSVNVIGSDFCHAMLQVGRQKVPDGSIEFIEADSQALPFDDDLFGSVTVAFGLRNVADTDQGIREMARVCRPGGKVLILEFSQPRLWGLRQVYSYYFRNVLPRIGQWFAKNDKSAYEYLPQSVGQFPDGQALADRMIAARLTHVRFTPMTFGVATIYEGTVPEGGVPEGGVPEGGVPEGGVPEGKARDGR